MRSAALAALLLAACWRGSEPPPAPPPSPPPIRATRPARVKPPIELAIEKFEEFADRMCACHDQTCADHLQEELTTWAQANARSGHDDADKPTPDQARQMQDIGTRYGECMINALGAGPSGP